MTKNFGAEIESVSDSALSLRCLKQIPGRERECRQILIVLTVGIPIYLAAYWKGMITFEESTNDAENFTKHVFPTNDSPGKIRDIGYIFSFTLQHQEYLSSTYDTEHYKKRY